jgi:hypothetical protein
MRDGTENITDRTLIVRSVVPVSPHAPTVKAKIRRIEDSKKECPA